MRSTRITGLSVSMLISGYGRRLLCLVRSCQESKGKKVVDLVRRRTAELVGAKATTELCNLRLRLPHRQRLNLFDLLGVAHPDWPREEFKKLMSNYLYRR
jgi:hypothetical protein